MTDRQTDTYKHTHTLYIGLYLHTDIYAYSTLIWIVNNYLNTKWLLDAVSVKFCLFFIICPPVSIFILLPSDLARNKLFRSMMFCAGIETLTNTHTISKSHFLNHSSLGTLHGRGLSSLFSRSCLTQYFLGFVLDPLSSAASNGRFMHSSKPAEQPSILLLLMEPRWSVAHILK